MRRPPILPTLIVLVAVGIMIALGFWQLGRLHEKEALLSRYEQAQAASEEIVWPRGEGEQKDQLYRRARLTCDAVADRSSMAGRNAKGEPGVAQTAQCVLPNGARALVVLGWSRQPNVAANWQGGNVHGVIAPGPRLVADPPLDGLEANAAPDPSEIPNNHLSYAIQWFFFAATAVVIYVLALGKRRRAAPERIA
ncbi:SURF1 family protein [Novosphingobium endophyticum]|nr:SURF1 family protein [Novosphingobium endophyticum]